MLNEVPKNQRRFLKIDELGGGGENHGMGGDASSLPCSEIGSPYDEHRGFLRFSLFWGKIESAVKFNESASADRAILSQSRDRFRFRIGGPVDNTIFEIESKKRKACE
jgi:hypothetical protein